MELRIVKIGKNFVLEADGKNIPNVKDFEIKSSASGKTELTVRLEFDSIVFDLLVKKGE